MKNLRVEKPAETIIQRLVMGLIAKKIQGFCDKEGPTKKAAMMAAFFVGYKQCDLDRQIIAHNFARPTMGAGGPVSDGGNSIKTLSLTDTDHPVMD